MNVKPCRDENAIKIVAFAFIFEREFSSGELAVLEALHKGDTDDLPRKQKHGALKIQFNPAQKLQASSTDVGGITFDRVKPSGEPEWAFIAKGNTVVVQCTLYSRWVEIWQQVKSYIDRFVPSFSEDNSITGVGLEYLDEFEVINPGEPWLEELFRKDSKHLTQNIFEAPDFWHCHTGFFSVPEEAKSRILTRISLDYVQDDRSAHKVAARTQHELKLNEAVAFEKFRNELMDNLIEEMHTLNKSILIDILNPEMANAIKLEVNK